MMYIEAKIHVQIDELMLTKEDILFIPLFKYVTVYFFDISKTKHYEDLSHLNLKDENIVQSSDLMNVPYQKVEHVKPGTLSLIYLSMNIYRIKSLIFT